MSSFGTAFLQTTADAANKKFAEKTAEDTKIKDAQRQSDWKIAFDTSGQWDEPTRKAAMDRYVKSLPPSLRKNFEKFQNIYQPIQKIVGAQSAQSQPVQQQPPQAAAGAPPSPSAGLPTGPSTPPPAQSTATLAMPPGGGAMTTQPSTPKPGAQPATPPPQAAQSENFKPGLPAGPKTAPPQPAQQVQLPHRDATMDAAAAQQAQRAARDAETFKTDEQIRAKTAEDKAAADQKDQERTVKLKAIDDNPDLDAGEKKQARLDAWGIKLPPPEAMSSVHYQDAKGDWHPALHDPGGNLYTLDHKPVDRADVKDVRPEPPVEQKPTGELAQREEIQKILDDPKASKTDKKAAEDTKKNLDKKAEAVVVKVNTAADKIKQDTSAVPEEDVQKWMNAARGHALYGVPAPPLGMANSPTRKAFNAAYSRVLSDISPEELAKDRADFKAGSASLTQLERQSGVFGALEGAFDADLENARTVSRAVPRTSMKKFNSIAQLFKGDWTDDPALAQLNVATQTAVNQYAKVATSTTGQTTDTARAEAMALLDKAMAKGTFDAALDQMEKEAHNRIAGIDSQIDKQKNAIASPKARESLSGPPKITGADDYNKLKPGTVYIDPQGVQRTKQ